MNILDLIPNRLLCGELKLLYKSGRLQDFFSFERMIDPNHMALTKIEKMFVRWAMRKYYRNTERELLKQQMLKHAITGGHRFESTVKIPQTFTSVWTDPGKVGLALQDPGGKEISGKVVQEKTNKGKP